MYETEGKHTMFLPEPTSLAILEIPEFYTVTDKGDSFLLYDPGIQNEDQLILIFGSDKNLEMLSFLVYGSLMDF